MSAKPSGGSAFPVPEDNQFVSSTGMTLRQWYAGKYMQGSIASRRGPYDWKTLAADSFSAADAMIAHQSEDWEKERLAKQSADNAAFHKQQKEWAAHRAKSKGEE